MLFSLSILQNQRKKAFAPSLSISCLGHTTHSHGSGAVVSGEMAFEALMREHTNRFICRGNCLEP